MLVPVVTAARCRQPSSYPAGVTSKTVSGHAGREVRGLREAAGLSPLPAFNLQPARLVLSPARAGDAAAALAAPTFGSWQRLGVGREGADPGLGVTAAPHRFGAAPVEERGRQQTLCGVGGGGSNGVPPVGPSCSGVVGGGCLGPRAAQRGRARPICLRVTPRNGAGRPLPREPGDPRPRKEGMPRTGGMGREGKPNSGHLGIVFWTRVGGSTDHRGRVNQGSSGHVPAAPKRAMPTGEGAAGRGAGVLPRAPSASALLAPTSLLLTGPLGIFLSRSVAGVAAAVGLPGMDEPGGSLLGGGQP